MEKTNFTHPGFSIDFIRVKSLLAFFVILTLSHQLSGQCTLVCKEANISIDIQCGATLTPDMFLSDPNNGQVCNPEAFEIVISDHHKLIELFRDTFPMNGGGVYWANAGAFLDKQVKVTIAEVLEDDNGPENSCWNYALVEDKYPPRIPICPPDVTVACYDVSSLDLPPAALDDCSLLDEVRLVNEEIILNDCDGDDLDTIKIIRRSYVAIDKSGNVSDTCFMNIIVERINDDLTIGDGDLEIEGLELPPDVTLECSEVNGEVPPATPGGAGVPTIKLPDITIYIHPIGSGEESVQELQKYCGIASMYEDIEIINTGCYRKIIRMWTVREWFCSEENEVQPPHMQVIEIFDTMGPEFEVPHDFKATTNGYTCEAEVYIPEIDPVDECDNGIAHVDIRITNILDGDTTPVIYYSHFDFEESVYVPEGHNIIEYIVFDDCHNVSVDSLWIWVEDHTQPVVVCESHTVINLTINGDAILPASVLDDGSFDDCGLKQMLVRRMDPVCGCEDRIPEFSTMHFLDSIDGHYYYISHDSVPGHKAFKLANAMGGYVAAIGSYEEDSMLFELVRDKFECPEYWIGLYDKPHEGYFEWQNGENFVYDNWAEGEPDYTDEEDFVIVSGKESWSWVETFEYIERRYILEIEDPCGWSETTTMCCEDMATPQMVQFRAIDKWGNYNDCMSTVTVQDKIPPKIECPPDLTIACEYDYVSLDEFGKVVESMELRDPIIIPEEYLYGAETANGKVGPGDEGWPPQLWDGFAMDNCDVLILGKDSSDLNQCGLGDLFRKFYVTTNGSDDTVSCTQRLTFISTHEEIFIDWPDNITIYECKDVTNTRTQIPPEEYGAPIIAGDDECDLIGASFWDTPLSLNNGTVLNDGTEIGCFKLLRYWTVIDWCDLDENREHSVNGEIEYIDTYEQIILVYDTIHPVIFDCEDREPLCSFDPDCHAIFYELTKDATDADMCTNDDTLRWEIKIDLYNDHEYDTYFMEEGEKVFFEFAPLQYGPEADASGLYPEGEHRVLWTVEDLCGNISSCEELFTISNCKPATPYCYASRIVDLVLYDNDEVPGPDTAYVISPIEAFDAGTIHPCGYEVLLSFSEDVDSTMRVFTCEDALMDQPIQIQMYTTVVNSLGDTLQAFCNIDLTVRDTTNFCGDPFNSEAEVSGLILTETDNRVQHVSVDLVGSELESASSNETGEYAFPLMPLGGSYKVDPAKNDNHGNGVSTLDMVLIQQHIMGMKDLDSPLKMIAADINLDKKITAIDLVQMRKIILGIVDEYPNNESWRFVDQSYSFIHPENPFNEEFPEEYRIDNLQGDMQVNFSAIKIGDVNASVEVNGVPGPEVRNRSEILRLVAGTSDSELNSEVRIPVAMGNSMDLNGFQFTLTFDPQKLEFHALESGTLELGSHNMAWNRLQNGQIPMSWHQIGNPVSLAEGETLFTLVFVDKQTSGDRYIGISSEIAEAEAYNSGNEIIAIELSDDRSLLDSSIELYQNRPNPFSETTSIGFVIPQDMDVKITVYNATGQILKSIQDNFSGGYHEIQLARKELASTGVLYYTLKTENYTATKRMIVID